MEIPRALKRLHSQAVRLLRSPRYSQRNHTCGRQAFWLNKTTIITRACIECASVRVEPKCPSVYLPLTE